MRNFRPGTSASQIKAFGVQVETRPESDARNTGGCCGRVMLTAGVVGLAGASTLLVDDGIVAVSHKISDGVQVQPLGAVN